jgi:hypothetical protein
MNPSEHIKTLETTQAYNHQDIFWWMHNDVCPSEWSENGIVIPKRKWDKWFNENFEVFSANYKFKNKKELMAPKNVRGKLKTGDTDLVVYVKYNLETKKEYTLEVEFYWSLDKQELAQKFIKEIMKMQVYKVDKTKVYMVIQDDGGLDLRSFDINIPDLDIEMNYGEEWATKHDYLMEALSRENKKGIALLHGLPGTGKSMYIRYLISLLAETRTMIYLPNQLINSLTDPGFLPLMADFPNSVLIIEDAEEAIKSRKQGGATVDKLLNLSDGIISDFLGTQIICTFNSDITTIDEALLRKGRLILKHEFKKLDQKAAQKLSDHLGKNTTIDKPMTVSEVYNQEEVYSEMQVDRKTIGFGSK